MPDNVAFLVAAFVIAGLLICGYLLFVGGRIGGLRGEVESLRDELDARATAPAAGRAEGGEAGGHPAEARRE